MVLLKTFGNELSQRVWQSDSLKKFVKHLILRKRSMGDSSTNFNGFYTWWHGKTIKISGLTQVFFTLELFFLWVYFLLWWTTSGWWCLEPWNLMTFHSVGNTKSSQLTFTPSFFRWVGEKPPTRYCCTCLLRIDLTFCSSKNRPSEGTAFRPSQDVRWGF